MELNITTFNIRCDYNQDGENSFVNRKARVLRAIQNRNPDVICFQEVLPHVAGWLTEVLTDYYVVGTGRGIQLEDERTVIAFLKARFSLVQLHSFWLSESPEVPGSRYGGQSTCPRICTMAVLQENAAGELVRVYNLHLDHEGARSRVLSVQQVMRHIEEEKTFGDAPVIIAGDFNAEPEWEEMRVLREHPSWQELTAQCGGTFHDYGQLDDPEYIDYIFADRKWSLVRAERWTEVADGIYLSDHYPVSACVQTDVP